MPDETRHESEDLADFEVDDTTDTLLGPPGQDPLDADVVPPERWSAGIRYGTTEEEQAEGESLDQLLAEEEPDDTLELTEDELEEDDEDEEDVEEYDAEDDAGDEDVDGILLDDGPDPRPAGWWPRTRAPIRTRRRTWSPPTSGSTAAARPPRKRPCTSSRKTTTTSARSNAAAGRAGRVGPCGQQPDPGADPEDGGQVEVRARRFARRPPGWPAWR